MRSRSSRRTRTTARAKTSSSSASSCAEPRVERQAVPQHEEHERDDRGERRRPPDVEDEVRDEENGARDRRREQEQPDDRQVVRDNEHALLVLGTPAEPVVRARRDQERSRDGGEDERGEVDAAVARGQLREAARERHCEQKREQHLHAREGHAELVEELDQLTVDAILRRLVRHGRATLVEPLLAREAADRLDAAVDRLHDDRVVDRDADSPVRQSVRALLLAVLRVGIDNRLAKTVARQSQQVKPKLLNLRLSIEMVRKEVARHAKPVVGDVEAFAKESTEELHKRGIGVAEASGTAAFVTLGPIQHAARDEERIASRSASTACGLGFRASSPPFLRVRDTAGELSVEGGVARL